METARLDFARGEVSLAEINNRAPGAVSEVVEHLFRHEAGKMVATLTAPIDLVFLDADKDGYVDYLNRLAPLVRPGGLILAHNVDSAPDYLKRVTTDPQFETIRLTEGSGMSVTIKKRPVS